MIALGIREIPAGMGEHDSAYRLLACMYEELLGEPVPEICVAPGGKPSFADGRVRFSLSHTRGLAVCVLSIPGTVPAGPYTVLDPTEYAPEVGVDAEYVRADADASRLCRIVGRFFPREEQKRLAGVPKEAYPGAFYENWTRLESFVKMTGRGIRGGFPTPGEDVEFISLVHTTDTSVYRICCAFRKTDLL